MWLEKIYDKILVDRVCRVIEGLIDGEQGGFHIRLDQIFTLKQKGEKAHKKQQRVCTGFINQEKAYDGFIGKPYGRC